MGTASCTGDDCPSEIDRLRESFEEVWDQPGASGIEQILGENPNSNQTVLLRELLYVEFELTKKKHGELLLDRYLERFPGRQSLVREVAEKVGEHSIFRHPKPFKPQKISVYTLHDEIGGGGMGTVYKAWDNGLKKFVALKTLKPELLGDKKSRERFNRECAMVGQLKHPNIVGALHADVNNGEFPFTTGAFMPSCRRL